MKAPVASTPQMLPARQKVEQARAGHVAATVEEEDVPDEQPAEPSHDPNAWKVFGRWG